MIKDIFIDNNVAKNFKNPVDPHYKKLIDWLYECGHLVLSQKLLKEYYDSNRGNWGQSIITIINRPTKDERLVRISNEQMENLRFPKRLDEKYQRLNKDYWHIKAILLSNRKLAIIIDSNFRNAINDHPKHDGVSACAVSRPEEVNYENYVCE